MTGRSSSDLMQVEGITSKSLMSSRFLELHLLSGRIVIRLVLPYQAGAKCQGNDYLRGVLPKHVFLFLNGENIQNVASTASMPPLDSPPPALHSRMPQACTMNV